MIIDELKKAVKEIPFGVLKKEIVERDFILCATLFLGKLHDLSEDEGLVDRLARVLTKIFEMEDEAVSVLLPALSDEDPRVRVFSTILLTTLTPQRQGILDVVVPALNGLLNDRDEYVQDAAQVALNRMDPKNEIAESDIDDILEDVLGSTGYDPFEGGLTLSDFDMEEETCGTAWGTASEIETALQPGASP